MMTDDDDDKWTVERANSSRSSRIVQGKKKIISKVVRGRKIKIKELGEIMQREAIGESTEWKQLCSEATKRKWKRIVLKRMATPAPVSAPSHIHFK